MSSSLFYGYKYRGKKLICNAEMPDFVDNSKCFIYFCKNIVLQPANCEILINGRYTIRTRYPL